MFRAARVRATRGKSGLVGQRTLRRVVAMSLFHSSSRQQPKPHAHPAGDRCPTCEQPIGQDIARQIEARLGEQRALAQQQAKAEAEAAATKRIAAERQAIQAQAEQAALAKLADIQARLAQAELARVNVEQQMAALQE